MDPERLLLKINSGKSLSKDELEQIVEQLNGVDCEDLGRKLSVDDIYSYLLVLGRAEATEQRRVIERYLNAKDALTVSLVLDILCLKWGPIGQYLERVIKFALGVPWDEEEDLKLMALKILGEHLHEKWKEKTRACKREARDLHVLELLVGTLDDTEAQSWTRQAAYFALCRAGLKSWEELPSECAQLDFSKGSEDIDWEMISYFRELLTDVTPDADSVSSDSPSGFRPQMA